ncbi:16S rRNA processing protein RimM [Clostridium sp. 'deep sea']|uniref:ribosome maturation factor RimM n=1 Tax=Clostridium sp. 'deep sea' TaxID=2779445 RepID=UPI0018964E72|nr:ribosome maturation factor RimM [Clostridium sp. 'deep sea']QOR36069.1 16S rRNA processing protein RimM [Clostridium sp. 'deep sea']
MSSKYVNIAKITSTHGLNGDMRIFPVISPPQLLNQLDHMYIKDNNGEMVKISIEKVRPYKKSIWLLKIKEWQTIEQVELFKGHSLFLPKEELPKLPQNSYYIGDLLGSQVISENGEPVGELIDVLERGSSDLYVIKTDSKELLLPVVKEFVLSVNIDDKIITVNIPEGLWDL